MPASPTSVPFLDLHAGNRRVEAAFFRDLKTLFRRSDFIGGPTVETFERAFAAAHDAPQCVAVSSGTAALHLSLIAAGLGPGDEVIVPAFTFPGAALPVLHCGARPVFADVNPGDGCLDPESVARLTTKKTRAILVTHLFGHPADLDALRAIARSSRGRIALIEDAAQAHGGTWRGRALGTFGAFGCFSFYPTKNLGGMGDAGAILTRTRAHADRLRRLRDHGQTARFRPVEAGFNARMDAVQALFLTHKLPFLREDNARRAVLAAHIAKALTRLDVKALTPLDMKAPARPHGKALAGPDTGADRAAPFPACVALRPDVRGTSSWHACVVRTPQRAVLVKRLKERGIGHQIYYPAALPDLPVYRDLMGNIAGNGAGREKAGVHGGDVPVARALARTCVALPLHPALTAAHRRALLEALTADR